MTRRDDGDGAPGGGGGGGGGDGGRGGSGQEALAALGAPAGLCAACRHASVLSSRSSTFLRCGMAEIDPSFPKYPGLPVVSCRGYDPVPGGAGGAIPA